MRQSRMPVPSAVVVTDRDLQIIEWLARFGYATTPILCQRFEASYDTMRWRVSRLAQVGLLRQERCHRPWILIPTADGLELVASPLGVPSFSLVRIRHTLGLAALGAEAELAGRRVWSEREIRIADRGRRRLRLSVHMPRASKTRAPVWHVPDLVIAHPPPAGGAPLLEAVELELTRKSTARLTGILTAYAASPLFTRVTYYARFRSIAVAVEDTAAAISLHARQLIHVRPHPDEYATENDLTEGALDVDAQAIRWVPTE